MLALGSALPTALAPTSAAAGPVGLTIDTHRGFDSCNMADGQLTIPDLQNWWAGSPYYDYYVYIDPSAGLCGGEVNRTYISQANAIGYAFMPIWFGLQAGGNCPSTSQISTNTTTAYGQGATEGEYAINQALSLGFLQGSAIALDLESWSGSSACTQAVNSYINGWDHELAYYAWASVVYATPGNASLWFQGVNGQSIQLPGGWWSADKGGTDNVWNVSGMSNSNYAYDQRYSQYSTIYYNGPHGGTHNYQIDQDCANSYMNSGIDAFEIYAEGAGEGANDPVEDPGCN